LTQILGHPCEFQVAAAAAAAAAAEPAPAAWRDFDGETARPRFALRGLNPFYNFAQGPDWWSGDHWRAVLTQGAKLRLNMVALHTYSPTRNIGPASYSETAGSWQGQPQLWVGTAGNVTADGNVSAAGSYGVSWASTGSGSFSLQSGKGTSGYPFGASLPYATECCANPEVFPGDKCQTNSNIGYPSVFAAAAKQLRGAFSFGKILGYKFALGNEVPVFSPAGSTDDVYEGIFTWLARTGLAPLLDYYWMWTGEVWPARRATDMKPGA
jgi:hypothetical protein